MTICRTKKRTDQLHVVLSLAHDFAQTLDGIVTKQRTKSTKMCFETLVCLDVLLFRSVKNFF